MDNIPIGWIHGPLRDQRWAKKLLIRAHCPTWALPYMIAIAGAESGYNPRAINANTNGTQDTGVWQVNDVWFRQIPGAPTSSLAAYHRWLFGPENNARAVVHVLNQQGLQAWSTFNNGSYKAFWPVRGVL